MEKKKKTKVKFKPNKSKRSKIIRETAEEKRAKKLKKLEEEKKKEQDVKLAKIKKEKAEKKAVNKEMAKLRSNIKNNETLKKIKKEDESSSSDDSDDDRKLKKLTRGDKVKNKADYMELDKEDGDDNEDILKNYGKLSIGNGIVTKNKNKVVKSDVVELIEYDGKDFTGSRENDIENLPNWTKLDEKLETQVLNDQTRIYPTVPDHIPKITLPINKQLEVLRANKALGIFIVQTPSVLPVAVKNMKQESGIEQDKTIFLKNNNINSNKQQKLDQYIGKLVVYKSGKVKIRVDNPTNEPASNSGKRKKNTAGAAAEKFAPYDALEFKSSLMSTHLRMLAQVHEKDCNLSTSFVSESVRRHSDLVLIPNIDDLLKGKHF